MGIAVEPRLARTVVASFPGMVNDVAIRVGTVNGSGSQSANQVLVRAIFGMGVPCAAKNVFPSNIEGLPTWFHIRANARSHLGYHPEPHILVCMNPQTAAKDLDCLRPGGLCFYRDEFDRDADFQKVRDRRASDTILVPVPFAQLAEQAYPPDNKKTYRDTLRKVVNMVYVGVLAKALGIELEEVHSAIGRQFPGRKVKAVEVNIAAADRGFEWAEDHLPKKLPYRVQRMAGTTGKILVDGNQAAAMGAVFGGANVLTWYPITPSSSLAESAEAYLGAHRTGPDGGRTFAVVQAEDELAAIGMCVGAGWAGARAMTATSGPGISLMTEFVGMAYFAEIPVVVIDVQRVGPSTGLPTRTSQGDVLKLHLLGHGDCRHIVLIPSTPDECFSMTIEALDLAQEFQTPVFVALDLDLGMNLWMSERFSYPSKPLSRGKVLTAADLDRLGGFARYRDVDGDGVCWRTLPGTEHPRSAYFTRGTGHNDQSGYSELPEDWARNLDRLARKLETARDRLPRPVITPGASASTRIGLIAYGSSHAAALEAGECLQEEGYPVCYCRLRALPVDRAVSDFVARFDRVYVVEQNRDGQVYQLLRSTLDGTLDDRLVSVTHYSGTPIAAADITRPILDWEQAFSHRSVQIRAHDHAQGPVLTSGLMRSTE